jgi:hypothetical protein
VTPSGSFLFVGDKKDLALGVGKDHCSLIATLGHNVASSSRCALPHNKLPADRTVVGRVVNYGGNVELSNGGRNIIAIQQHTIADELDVNLADEPRELLAVGQIVPALAGRERNGAIHRTSIEEPKAEPPRQLTRCATLSGSGRSVDGYDHSSV